MQQYIWWKLLSKVPDGQYYYMKYYVTSDIHGFYMEFQDALKSSGYYEDKEPHKLIIIRDLFDRGSEAKRLQAFILYKYGKPDPDPR